MANKSKKIGFLQRWMFIIDKINSHPYITKEELEYAVKNEMLSYDGVENVGISSRTIDRDIFEIRNSPYMDISIEYCRKRNGYYIPQNENSLSKLDRLFELSSLLSFSSLKDIVIMENRQSKGLEHRFTLISAIQKAREISLEYCKYKKDSPDNTLRRLQPYALREFKNKWYLLAVEIKADGSKSKTIKTWGLDRIKRLTITNRIFQKDDNIDLDSHFEHCFGIYADQKTNPEKVILSFSPLSGKYADSYPLHESQKILIHNDKEFRIELTIKVTPDFITELLTHSEGMRVIEPQHLKERLIEIHRKAIELNN
ncbi:YafY family protein [Bacteroides sp. 519]|uniref:helix-turn-helix transcriptional regulator n=1 Tax=Bacteroides sp. 519 TaxID=2302937 RepID=UPI0013D887B3|nr:WYL domain-containing protein [Bacteroides sp. 519]NDV56628.1 WYL domain-containing protein [Bacteroides sp. 519]